MNSHSIFEIVDINTIRTILNQREDLRNESELAQQYKSELQLFTNIQQQLMSSGCPEFLQTWDGSYTVPNIQVFDLKSHGIVKSLTEEHEAFLVFQYQDSPQIINLRVGFDTSGEGVMASLEKFAFIGLNFEGYSYSYYRSIQKELFTSSAEEFEIWMQDYPREYKGLDYSQLSSSGIVATLGTKEQKQSSYLTPTYCGNAGEK